MRALLLVVMLTACGGDIGDECENSSSTDECVDGAICTREATQTVCRKICDKQDDCAAGESCNGVPQGTGKSCQPDELF